MKMSTILDASALLAVILQEPGFEDIEEFIEAGTEMTAVNMAEVMIKLLREGFTHKEIEELIFAMPIHVSEVDPALAYLAAYSEPETRSLGLSLADRICIAHAARSGYLAITTDKIWAKVTIKGFKVKVVR